MSPTRRRPERVAEVIREHVAAFLTSEVKDPRIGFVTVTGVEVSPALTHARVRVSVLGSLEERERTLEGLRSVSGFLRRELGRTLRLKTSPELVFEYDRGLEHAMRINRVLHDLKRESGGGEPGAGGGAPA